jgi:hypothetical protein
LVPIGGARIEGKENGKMRPAETIPGMGGGRIKENDENPLLETLAPPLTCETLKENISFDNITFSSKLIEV